MADLTIIGLSGKERIAPWSDRLRSLFRGESIRKRLAFGTFWLSISSAATQGSVLVISVITARVLGQSRFGEFGMIQSTSTMFTTFAGLGLGITAAKYVAEYRGCDASRAGRVIGLSTMTSVLTGAVVSGALFAFAPFFAEQVMHAAHLTEALRVTAALLFLTALNSAQIGTLQGFEAFRSIAYVNLWRAVFAVPVSVVAVLKWGLNGAIWALVALTAIACVFSHSAIRRACTAAGVAVMYRSAWSERSVLWKFAVPSVVCNLTVAPVVWSVNAILVSGRNGYAEMGVFAAAYQWNTWLSFLPILLGRALMPILSALWRGGQQSDVRRAIGLSAGACAAFALPATVIVAGLSGWIMSWYGPGYASRRMTLITMAIVAAVYAVQSPFGTLIMSSGRMWLGALTNLAWGIVLLGTAAALVSARWGADGVAVAYLIAYATNGILAYLIAKRLISNHGIRQ